MLKAYLKIALETSLELCTIRYYSNGVYIPDIRNPLPIFPKPAA